MSKRFLITAFVMALVLIALSLLPVYKQFGRHNHWRTDFWHSRMGGLIYD